MVLFRAPQINFAPVLTSCARLGSYVIYSGLNLSLCKVEIKESLKGLN